MPWGVLRRRGAFIAFIAYDRRDKRCFCLDIPHAGGNSVRAYGERETAAKRGSPGA